MKLSLKYIISFLILITILATFFIVAFPKENDDTFYNTINYKVLYSKCNHETTKEEKCKKTTFNKNIIKNEYPEFDAKIENHTLILSKTENNYCEKHYLAYLKDSVVTILRLNDNFIIRQFKINTDVLTEDETNSLKSGISLYDVYDLTNFIEDYSS